MSIKIGEWEKVSVRQLFENILPLIQAKRAQFEYFSDTTVETQNSTNKNFPPKYEKDILKNNKWIISNLHKLFY